MCLTDAESLFVANLYVELLEDDLLFTDAPNGQEDAAYGMHHIFFEMDMFQKVLMLLFKNMIDEILLFVESIWVADEANIGSDQGGWSGAGINKWWKTWDMVLNAVAMLPKPSHQVYTMYCSTMLLIRRICQRSSDRQRAALVVLLTKARWSEFVRVFSD